ncbi:MAG TPA: hypothetical protein DEP00_01190 [Lachnospiraceae bacterium]|nr:hypothetical protein [Lachnospiraceae bacterium]
MLYLTGRQFLNENALKSIVKGKRNDDSGMATIEAILLICVLIALVIMFKDTIIDFVAGLLDNISGQGTVFDPDALAP